MATPSAASGNGTGSITHLLEALERAIEDTLKAGGANAVAVAEEGRRILGLARTLAEDIARTTGAEIADNANAAWHRTRDFAQHEAEVAREAVRARPLAVVSGVAVVSALTAMAVTLAIRR